MKRFRYAFVGVVAIGLIAIIILLLAPKSPVLPAIKRQLTSTLLLPQGGGIRVDPASVKYDASTKYLSYTASYAATTLTASEQPTPETFIDIPQTYDKVILSMGTYKSFDVGVGTVHITKPQNTNSQQVGVINAKGTLMFVRASKDLTDDQWRLFFKTLAIEQ